MNIPKSIVVFGASSAFGKHDVEGGGFVGRLRRWHDEIDAGNATYNLAISGQCIEDLYDRFEAECGPRKPNLIVLQLGNNDAMRQGSIENPPHTDYDEYEAQLGQLLSRMKEIAPIILVGSMPFDEARTTPVHWADVFYKIDDVRNYEQIQKNLAIRAGIEYIDMFAEWEGDELNSYLDADGLHANSEGHEFIFEKIRDKILAVYGANQ